MKTKVYVGFDIGVKGAISVIDSDLNCLEMIDYSEHLADEFSLIKHKYDVHIVVAEKVNAMPDQGVTSMFSFGEKLGEFKGIMNTLGLRHDFVRPSIWMKEYSCPKDKKKRKKHLSDAASRLFPLAELYGPRGGIKDGRSDSLLMAL